MANSSRSDFLGSASARFLDELLVLSALLASHNPKNSSAILEFASLMDGAESSARFCEFASRGGFESWS